MEKLKEQIFKVRRNMAIAKRMMAKHKSEYERLLFVDLDLAADCLYAKYRKVYNRLDKKHDELIDAIWKLWSDCLH